ncbi:hypothetical protein N7451_004833 [Penicillium sp. IBT 35674x]|nr:hypothetical protein N7451_004833 [Penicillium sp. IBT 35674x]
MKGKESRLEDNHPVAAAPGPAAPVARNGSARVPVRYRRRRLHQLQMNQRSGSHHEEFGSLLMGNEEAYIRSRLGSSFADTIPRYDGRPDGSKSANGDPIDWAKIHIPAADRSLVFSDVFPTPSQAFVLWEVFQENVAPVVPIIHKPSFQALLMEMSAAPEQLDLNTRVLFLTVFLSSVISMSDEECVRDLDDTRTRLMTSFRQEIKAIFSRARVLETRDFTLLQAVVLYLSCTRKHLEETSYVWAMTTVILRLARNIGLHRVETSMRLDPFEIQMRRRLWWHICFLDVRCSEDQGTDAEVLDMCFDTCLPLNVNDYDLIPGSRHAAEERTGVTDMTLADMRYESIAAVRTMRKLMDGSPHSTTNNCQCKGQWVEAVQNLNRRLWTGYLSHCDPTTSASQLLFGLARIVPKVSFVFHQPVFGLAPVDVFTRDWIFLTAVEAVEFCHFIDDFSVSAKWRWHFRQSSVRWYLLKILLIELCVRPPSPLVERAWLAVSSAYQQWCMRGSGDKWQTISVLMQRARSRRTIH